MSKKFGLILPASKAGSSVAAPKANFSKPSVFGSDSDSDDPGLKKKTAIGPGATEKRLARRIQEKALKEDPTVFQYDELYDDIETKRDEEKKSKSDEVKKPKYIGRLLEYAERRKIENERRQERIVQKEREEEGEEFADKESFVTSAYRKKLEELKAAEEREKREDYLEAIGDVTKQQDLGGFYRHIYEQKLKTKEEKPAEKVTEKPKSAKPKPIEPEPDSESSSGEVQVKSASKPRVYRKRKASEDGNNSTPERKGSSARKAHLQSNLDADSDFSIDSSSSSSSSDEDNEKGVAPKKKKVDKTKNKKKSTPNKVEVVIKQEPVDEKPVEGPAAVNSVEQQPPIVVKAEDVKIEKNSEEKAEPKKEKKVKKDIWKKRTVGEAFDAALQRFYERKALRNG